MIWQLLNHTAHAPTMHGNPYPWTCDINDNTGLRYHVLMLNHLKHFQHFHQKFFQSLVKESLYYSYLSKFITPITVFWDKHPMVDCLGIHKLVLLLKLNYFLCRCSYTVFTCIKKLRLYSLLHWTSATTAFTFVLKFVTLYSCVYRISYIVFTCIQNFLDCIRVCTEFLHYIHFCTV
jgi:hypothetical protein